MPAPCLVHLDELVVLALGVRGAVTLLDEEDDAFLIGVVPLLLKLPADGWWLYARQEFWPWFHLRQQTALTHDGEHGDLVAATVAVEERLAVRAFADGERRVLVAVASAVTWNGAACYPLTVNFFCVAECFCDVFSLHLQLSFFWVKKTGTRGPGSFYRFFLEHFIFVCWREHGLCGLACRRSRCRCSRVLLFNATACLVHACGPGDPIGHVKLRDAGCALADLLHLAALVLNDGKQRSVQRNRFAILHALDVDLLEPHVGSYAVAAPLAGAELLVVELHEEASLVIWRGLRAFLSDCDIGSPVTHTDAELEPAGLHVVDVEDDLLDLDFFAIAVGPRIGCRAEADVVTTATTG